MKLGRRRRRWGAGRGMHPTRAVAVSFGAMIALGTLALLLPVMSRRGGGFFLSLFTATSATCVTGFTLVDTLEQWTLGGQAVILLLVQLGALGFMMAYSLVLLLLRREIIFSQKVVLASALGLKNTGGVLRLVHHGLLGTLLFEAVGTLLLALRFVPRFGIGRGLWYSLFHAVSAFCNGGFALVDMEDYVGDPYVLLIHMGLAITGGLGFIVWEDILRAKSWRKLSLYSHLAIGGTAVLLVLGWVYFTAMEWDNPGTLGALPPAQRVLAGLFQSANLRTAGFAVFPQGEMTESAQVVSMLFMLVGGCSGSTACGIKVVTVVVLGAALVSGLQGREEVVVGGRTIPQRQVRNAMTLTMVVIFTALIAALVMAHIEGGSFLPLFFESVAAIGTVGLSTGITDGLSFASHCVLLALMYLGRVGILAFSLAFLTKKTVGNKIKYPSCELLIG